MELNFKKLEAAALPEIMPHFKYRKKTGRVTAYSPVSFYGKTTIMSDMHSMKTSISTGG